MDGECGDKKTVKDFEIKRTKDTFMNKRRYKKRGDDTGGNVFGVDKEKGTARRRWEGKQN